MITTLDQHDQSMVRELPNHDRKLKDDRLSVSSRLKWLYCAIVVLSFVVSIFAWRYSKSFQYERDAARFDRESDQAIELVRVRMKNYADALWGSVAMIRANGGEVDYATWHTYANCIQIDRKYPGINGIGVVHAVPSEEVPEYVERQRKNQPGFRIHPELDGSVRYPVAYMVPEHGNQEAIGLDESHEANRFRALKTSRDTGKAQFTGPISLVQDDERTPGFLFFAPFYEKGTHETVEARRAHFSGLVVAPFVVRKLMHGVLRKDKRRVGIRLRDGDEVLYDEHMPSDPDFDPNPLFQRSEKIALYGRTWTFDVWSTRSFRTASNRGQPMLILLGGVTIDLLLMYLFTSILRWSRRIWSYATRLEASQAEAEERARQLELSNAELEQFALIASHDLQEPLRKVSSFCELLRDECGAELSENGARYANLAIDGASRMSALVQDLLAFSKVGSQSTRTELVNTEKMLHHAIDNLGASIEESGAIITHDSLPTLNALPSEMVQLFQNLVGNAINYRSERVPEIHVGVSSCRYGWRFSVDDNGIGIAPEYRQQVFGIFKRLHAQKDFAGTGIGLAICKRIVERMGGDIWFESKEGAGSRVCFTMRKRVEETPQKKNWKGSSHEVQSSIQ